jgi:hypothetical protein
MRWAHENNGLVCYLHEDPLPEPTPINGIVLKEDGWKEGKNNTYYKDPTSLKYDGVYWWCYHFAAMFKVETMEELKNLMA